MRAVTINAYGGPEVLSLEEVARPLRREGGAIVEVKAAAVNPADGKWRSGMFETFAPVTFPHILGYDIAGIVVEGEGFAPGTRVAGMLDPFHKGGYAEYAASPEQHLAAIPNALSFVQAAAIPTAGLTGTELIEEAIDAQPGQRLLITGALGAVGRFALRAARERGAEIVAVVRASQKEEALRLGADHALALGEEDWSGLPFDHVVDMIGGAEVARLCRHLAPGGRIVTAATTPIPSDGLSAQPQFFAVRPSGEVLARLMRLVEEGEIEAPVARTLPLEQAAEAQRLTEAGGLGGKVVLTF
jgi:NADPH:quinone reductase-like Zn-dependent oxidoreductase